MKQGTACWTTHGGTGWKVGTAVLTTGEAEAGRHPRIRVRDEAGKEREVLAVSITRMLPDEVPDWMKVECPECKGAGEHNVCPRPGFCSHEADEQYPCRTCQGSGACTPEDAEAYDPDPEWDGP